MLSFSIATASMRHIAESGYAGHLDGLGISQAEFEQLVSDVPWNSMDRDRMVQMLFAMIYASVDRLRLPRFQLPAEFIAAGICVFVKPVNVHAACRFAAETRLQEAEDMGRAVKGNDCTPEQLFALMIQLYDSPGRSSARALFEKKTGLLLDKALVGNGKAGK